MDQDDPIVAELDDQEDRPGWGRDGFRVRIASCGQSAGFERIAQGVRTLTGGADD